MANKENAAVPKWARSALIYTVVIILIVWLVLGLFLGGAFEGIGSEGGDRPTTTTSVTEQVTTEELDDELQLFYEYTLAGETEKVGPFDVTRLVPPDWDYKWKGPDSAQTHWSDGKVGPLLKNWGVKSGRVWFTGTVGDVVLVRIIPPGSE